MNAPGSDMIRCWFYFILKKRPDDGFRILSYPGFTVLHFVWFTKFEKTLSCN